MAVVLAIVPDLMLASKVEAMLTAAGHEVTLAASVPEHAGEAAALVADLNQVDAAAVNALGTPTLGFYSHVDVDVRRDALAAGIEQVVPRSRMARELPELVDGLLDP